MQAQNSEQNQKVRKTIYTIYEQHTTHIGNITTIQQFFEEVGLTTFQRKNVVELAWKERSFVEKELMEATPFIGDELTITFKYAQAVIVFLTGEERVRLCKEFWRKDDGRFEKIFCLQPSQEQIFEAGYAFGTFPRRTILVQIGDVRPFSDIAGMHILRFAGTNEDYNLLRARLSLAGCILKDMTFSPEERDEDEYPTPDPRKVFVVHGRNMGAKRAMFRFLESLGLIPIEWGMAVEFAGMGSPYTGKAVAAGIDGAQAVVVVLTGDDLVQLKTSGAKESSLKHLQPRPNVLFEAGMAFSKRRKHTILVQLGDIRPCHDIEGRSIIKLTNKSDLRWELIKRLYNAGCPVDVNGAWHSSGDFDVISCSE